MLRNARVILSRPVQTQAERTKPTVPVPRAIEHFPELQREATELEDYPETELGQLDVEKELERTPIGIEDSATSTILDDVWRRTTPFLDTATQSNALERLNVSMARREPITLRLFVDDYHEKFEAACTRGLHKRITRVELARRPRSYAISVGPENKCKSWQDFAYLNSIYIDVVALQSMMFPDKEKQNAIAAKKDRTMASFTWKIPWPHQKGRVMMRRPMPKWSRWHRAPSTSLRF